MLYVEVPVCIMALMLCIEVPVCNMVLMLYVEVPVCIMILMTFTPLHDPTEKESWGCLLLKTSFMMY